MVPLSTLLCTTPVQRRAWCWLWRETYMHVHRCSFAVQQTSWNNSYVETSIWTQLWNQCWSWAALQTCAASILGPGKFKHITRWVPWPISCSHPTSRYVQESVAKQSTTIGASYKCYWPPASQMGGLATSQHESAVGGAVWHLCRMGGHYWMHIFRKNKFVVAKDYGDW